MKGECCKMEPIADAKDRESKLIGVLLYFIMCMFLIMTISRNQIESMTVSGSDGMTYFNAARNLQKYHLLTHDRDGSMYEGLTEAIPTDTLAPGYPLFLRALFVVFPASLNTVFASNVVLGLITILLLWRMLRTLQVSPWISLLITFFYANYPTTVDMTTTCLTENLFCPLLFGSSYCCILAYKQKRGSILGIMGFLLLGLASTVRGQAFLFFPFQLILLLSDREKRKRWIYWLGVSLGSVLILYLPIWIWLAGQMGRFILYPTAGDGPRIWGAMPYFIDMTWTGNKSLTQIQEYNSTVAPGEYFRWRIFGMLWRMWFDCWSEDLPHSWYLTHWSLWLHTLIVLPTLILIPFFGRRYKREELYLASVPIILTLACLFYHGLPRYVSAGYPILFVLAGCNLERLWKSLYAFIQKKREKKPARWRNRKTVGWKKNAAMGIVGIMSVALIYSVCIFPWRVDEEQSSYRLRKYDNVSLEEARSGERISSQRFGEQDISVWNAIPEGNGRYWITWQDHAIIQLTSLEENPNNDIEKTVTRVILDVDGGNLYDFSTIYWLTEDVQTWNEDHVYSIPRSNLSLMDANQPEIWIDGDAKSLLIVPALFRGNEIAINQIIVEKYSIKE